MRSIRFEFENECYTVNHSVFLTYTTHSTQPDISNTKTNQKRYHIISNNTTQKKTNQTNYLLLHTAHPIRRHINIETRLNVKRDRIITCPERIYGRYLHTQCIQMPTSTFMGLASLSLSITTTLA